MTRVFFADGSNQEYDSATVKASGWLFCYDGDDTHAYPPHRIKRVVEHDRGDKHRGEKLTAESPHGRV